MFFSGDMMSPRLRSRKNLSDDFLDGLRMTSSMAPGVASRNESSYEIASRNNPSVECLCLLLSSSKTCMHLNLYHPPHAGVNSSSNLYPHPKKQHEMRPDC
jgi:hypothetical protein